MRLKRVLETEGYLLDPEAFGNPFDLEEAFGGEGPFELEIGSGKGTFLVQEGEARPTTRFLGIEVVKKYAAYAADRARRAGLSNVRVMGCDAIELVRERLPRAAFAALHIYFPDPWPMARHHKRRSIRRDTLGDLESLVAPGGALRIVTDHPEYAEWIAEVLQASTFEREAYEPTRSAREGELVGTNFERKYKLRDGRPSYPFQLRRPT